MASHRVLFSLNPEIMQPESAVQESCKNPETNEVEELEYRMLYELFHHATHLKPSRLYSDNAAPSNLSHNCITSIFSLRCCALR